MTTTLAELPPELLTQIVTHIQTAQTLLHLALTCKRLHEYTEKDGFRVFVQTRFPSIQSPPFWKDAAHALTTLSRAWDRKAFIARYIEPQEMAARNSNGSNASFGQGRRQDHGGRPRGQTMGYQPVIDSYDECTGNEWSSRREVLAWGAGAGLVMRIKEMGDRVEESYHKGRRTNDRVRQYDEQHHHKIDWMVRKEDHYSEGRDDITSLNLLRPSQKQSSNSEHIITGRASGSLECVNLSMEEHAAKTITNYLTHGRAVRSASVNNTRDPLLAACLSDSDLAIYPVYSPAKDTEPHEEISVIPSGKPGRTWSTRFLCHNRLAVGLGPSTEPIHIYDISPDGVSNKPLRKYSAAGADLKMSGDDRVDTTGTTASGTSSVYPIAPIGPSSQAGGAEGEIFLSGWYDGAVRLHDLRSASSCIAIYNDDIDTFSAIYSLLPLGRERFLAGGARHSIMKVFDLRMPGGKVYYATDLDPCSSQTSRNPPTPAPPHVNACCDYHYETKHERRDWNIFLNPRGPAFYRLGTRRSAESPVYSLSAPSAYSPSIYAGVENDIIQFDIVSMMDKHADPVFKYGPKKTGSRDTDIRNKWAPLSNDVMRLACYEQTTMGSMRLRVQSSVGDMESHVPGWDERWVDGRGHY